MKDYIRAGMHLQLQKIGRSEKDKQQIIKSFAGHQEYQQIQKLNVVGLDLSTMQNQAIHAIQVLLSKTNYQGDLEPNQSCVDGIGTITRPVLQFSPSQYYEAFGLLKHKSASGYDQYYGGDCKQALESLQSLYNKQFIISFDHKTFSEKKNKYVPGSVTIYAKLFGEVKEDFSHDVNGKEFLASITMILSSIFVFQLDKYNVLKPVDYISQIKQIDPYASKYVHLFVEQVLNQSRLNKKDGVVRLKIETLAYQLRMDGYIKNRKRQEIRKVIERSLEVAKAIEFITDYDMDDKMVEFQINYKKLFKVEKKSLQ
jgi:hypothetical protein